MGTGATVAMESLMTWWQGSTKAESVFTARAVAYYRHSAQDRQKNSVEIQCDQVRAWAAANQVEIIREFADRGKSGLTAEGRPAFTEMMALVRTKADFSKVLVLDVSRWGRFQDIDLSAQYYY
jgi:DNA invertase Pin-like site-specific DNA recombinase